MFGFSIQVTDMSLAIGLRLSTNAICGDLTRLLYDITIESQQEYQQPK